MEPPPGQLQEYIKHPILQAIVHVAPDELDIVIFARMVDGKWTNVPLEYLDDVLTLSGRAVTSSLPTDDEGVPLIGNRKCPND